MHLSGHQKFGHMEDFDTLKAVAHNIVYNNGTSASVKIVGKLGALPNALQLLEVESMLIPCYLVYITHCSAGNFILDISSVLETRKK